ncbi:ABC transporter substrate-binding protein [Paenibacillus sp. SYP-B4298]|uniref:ABC transporter substrate-binding protein n=1 Tax=Paenibacillus sp. SYP-B4298 TaxID=2996034 RepID=UPI0022DDAF92|nr:extracellular solute-binding protein [Paenibacillus sp. SYP-B4298]
MRNWLSWGWVVLYVLALAGVVLVSSLNRVDSAEEDTAEKITLTFRHFWTREHDVPILNIFEEAVRGFQASHPNVKVNFEGMDQTVHREQKLKSEMVTGTPPDLFVLFGGAEIEPYVRAERLMDLSDFVRDNGLKSQFRDLHLWTFNDKVYGLPIEGNAEPIYYNRAIFDELGLMPPQTLDQLDGAIRVLTRNGYIPFALGNEDRWPAAIFAHYLMDRYAGPSLIERLIQGKEGYSFQNEGYLQAFQHFQRWARSGAFSPNANSSSTEAAIDLFTQGRAAMYLNGNWDITLFHSEEAPEFQQKVGVIPFPAADGQSKPSIAGGYTFGLGMSANLSGAKKEAALQLMQALYTKEVQKRIVYEGLRIPAMRIEVDSHRTGPVFAQVLELMDRIEYSFVPYDNILSPEVKRSFLQVVEEMVGGSSYAGEALEKLERASVQYWELRRSSGAGTGGRTPDMQ